MTKGYFYVVLLAKYPFFLNCTQDPLFCTSIWLGLKYFIQTPIICQYVKDNTYVLSIEVYSFLLLEWYSPSVRIVWIVRSLTILSTFLACTRPRMLMYVSLLSTHK